MSPVPVIVHRIRVVIGGIYTVAVVYVSVTIVIYAVGAVFTGVHPHVGRQILVGVVNTCVYDCYNHTATARCCIPRLGSVYVRVRRSTRLACVVQTPEIAETWIVGNGESAVDVIGRDQLHIRVLAQYVDQLLCGEGVRLKKQVSLSFHPGERSELLGYRDTLRPERRKGSDACTFPEPHEDFPFPVRSLEVVRPRL